MIFGIGTDITKISRFSKWVRNEFIIKRFFNENEFYENAYKEGCSVSEKRLCEYYAARFAAKEAFSKALGTGIRDFSLSDVFVTINENGKPSLCVQGSAEKILRNLCGNSASITVSLSHEDCYAVAFVVIEV